MTDLLAVTDDDRHDDAVDGDRLAEDDADEVLRADARRLHAGTEDARPRRVDTPVAGVSPERHQSVTVTHTR